MKKFWFQKFWIKKILDPKKNGFIRPDGTKATTAFISVSLALAPTCLPNQLDLIPSFGQGY